MKNLLWLPLLSIVFASCSEKKEIAKEIYTVAELKEDFDVFRASLEEGHPALYRYKSKTTMDSIFTTASASITKQMTDREFALLLCKVAAQIGDGHLRVAPPKVRKDSLDEGPTAIPFQTYYDNNKIFVRRNFSSLPDKDFLGAQIVSINGHTIQDFIKEMLLIFPSDGSNLTHIYRRGLQTPRWLTRYYYMLYGYTESYEIQYISFNDSAIKTTKLPGITFDNLADIRQKKYAAYMDAPPAEFNISTDNQYAILTINSFDKETIEKKKIDFEKFLANSFKNIETNHINNLILDLRGNGGGTDEYGKILFSYFSNQPFDYYESLRMNKESFNFFKYTNKPDAKAPEGMLKDNQEGTFDNIQHPNVGKQKPMLPTYVGNIYVLIDGGCFSTTCEFLSILHQNTKAVFIGEEAGGGYYGNSSGPAPEFKVPNTKVAIEIPLMNYAMAVKGYPYPDKGLIPDHIIIPSIKDKIENKDVEMKFVKSMIK